MEREREKKMAKNNCIGEVREGGRKIQLCGGKEKWVGLVWEMDLANR